MSNAASSHQLPGVQPEISEDQAVWNSSAPDALESCCPQNNVQG